MSTFIRAIESGDIDKLHDLLAKDASKINDHKGGNTPLHIAVAEGRADMVKILLDFGANTTVADRDGFTPLALAILEGDDDCTSLLLTKSEPSVFNQADKSGMTPLHLAVRIRDLNALKILLSKGADCKAKTKNGETALHLAAWMGDEETGDDAAMIKKLVQQHHLDVNAQASGGSTPLHAAALTGNIPALNCLISLNGKWQLCDDQGNTALHLAAGCSVHAALEMVNTILKTASAHDINLRNKEGSTAADLANQAGSKDVVDALVAAGAEAPRAKEAVIGNDSATGKGGKRKGKGKKQPVDEDDGDHTDDDDSDSGNRQRKAAAGAAKHSHKRRHADDDDDAPSKSAKFLGLFFLFMIFMSLFGAFASFFM